MILAILLITSPTSTHAVAKAALTSGLKPFLSDPDNKGKNEHD
jgi:multisubunit Na+/H+ antiporter MnhG subunit